MNPAGGLTALVEAITRTPSPVGVGSSALTLGLAVFGAMVGVGGVLWIALRFQRQQAGETVTQQAQILEDMRGVSAENVAAAARMKEERDELLTETRELRAELAESRTKTAELAREMVKLRDENDELSSEIRRCRIQLTSLRRAIQEQEARRAAGSGP